MELLGENEARVWRGKNFNHKPWPTLICCKESEVRGGEKAFYMSVLHERVEKKRPLLSDCVKPFMNCWCCVIIWKLIIKCVLSDFRDQICMCMILFMCIWFYAIVGIFETLNINMKFMKLMNKLWKYMIYHDIMMILCVV